MSIYDIVWIKWTIWFQIVGIMYSVREVISARHVSIYCVCLSVQWLVIRRHSAVNQISVPILRVSPRDRSYWRKESSHRCDIHRKSPRVRSYWKREWKYRCDVCQTERIREYHHVNKRVATKKKGSTEYCNKYMSHRVRFAFIQMEVLSVSVNQDHLDQLVSPDFINNQCLVPPGREW